MTEPEHPDVEGEENEDYDEELEEEAAEEEEEEEDDEDEEIEEEQDKDEGEIKPVKKRRCQRRRKFGICFTDELNEYEEWALICEEEEGEEEEEDEEEEEGEGGEWDVSSVSSILSAVSFAWEDEIYEFEELCDPGAFKTTYKPQISAGEIPDQFGVHRYLEMCTFLNISPVASILKALETQEVDLSYRNLDSKAIKAISAALEINTSVKKLIARCNDLRDEDCQCLGRILSRNEIISCLDFTGCRLKPESVGLLVAFLIKNETVNDLILSKCYIRDEGMNNLAYVLTLNKSIENLDLSYNKLESASGDALALVFMSNSILTSLNLRFNNLFEPSTMKNFFRYLAVNCSITYLDLSWNGMSGQDLGTYIGNFLKKSESIGYLDLSDNRFEGAAVFEIKNGLVRSKSLTTLKFGKNPLSLEDIESLVLGVKFCPTLQVLDLEDLWIENSLLKIVDKIKKDRKIEFNYAGVLRNYEIQGPDYNKLILRRAQFEAQKPKQEKKKRDFGHLMWLLGDEPITDDEFMKRVKKFRAKVSKELYPELINQFKNPKTKLINVVAMREKYLSIFPDSTPPPPPKPKGKKGKQKKVVEERKEVPDEEVSAGKEENEVELELGESEQELLVEREEDGENENDNEEENEEEERVKENEKETENEEGEGEGKDEKETENEEGEGEGKDEKETENEEDEGEGEGKDEKENEQQVETN